MLFYICFSIMFFNPEAVSQQPLSGSQLEKFSVLLPEHAAIVLAATGLIVTHCMRTLQECLKKQLSDSDTLMGIRRCNNIVAMDQAAAVIVPKEQLIRRCNVETRLSTKSWM